MDKDFKDRVPQHSSAHPVPPVWLWFLVGVLTGAFGSGLICLKTNGGSIQVTNPPIATTPSPTPPPVQEAAPEPTPEPRPKPENEPTPEPVQDEKAEQEQLGPEPIYDFYTILAGKEEVVNREEKEVAPQIPSPVYAAPRPEFEKPAVGEAQYMLQLGSYKRLEDAERRRAELALDSMRFDTMIQTVTIRDGEVYHRVRSGPFSSEDAAMLADHLRTKGVNSLTIRLKNE